MNAYALLPALVMLLGIGLFIGLCLIPANMAKSRGRSSVGWFFLSAFLITPLLGMIILACLGDTDARRRERIYEEEDIRRSLENRYSSQNSPKEEVSNEGRQIPNPSGRTINDLYKR